MKKIVLIFFFIFSCTNNPNYNKDKILNIPFSENISFEQFKVILEEYAKNKSYPDINN